MNRRLYFLFLHVVFVTLHLTGCNLLTGASNFEEGDCVPACPSNLLGNGACDAACNVAVCHWDDGDCTPGGDTNSSNDSESDTSSDSHSDTQDDSDTLPDGYCAPGCPDEWAIDDTCDPDCYVEACNWDGNACGAECAPGCPVAYTDDDTCDPDCFSTACNFDNGACDDWFICDLGTSEEIISEDEFCDGVPSCTNEVDENAVFCTLTGAYWNCQDHSGSLPLNYLCDGENDCLDGSDEQGCTTGLCDPDEFPCEDGTCIRIEFYNDGTTDCATGEDELLDERWFVCHNGSYAMPGSSVCDQSVDCTDGSDEWWIYCGTAPSDFVTCDDYSASIPTVFLCDGQNDCPDGSDESAQYCANLN